MSHTQWAMMPPPDFSFAEAIQAHGWRRLRPFAWRDDINALERVEQFPDGIVALLTLREGADGALFVTTSEDVDLTEAETRVRRMLQWDIPMTRFHLFCHARTELAHIPESRQGRILVSPTLWEDYLKVVLTTNTTWAQTISMTARVVDAFGSPLPGDTTRRAFPTPAQIASVPLAEFAETARLGYRSSSVHATATRITNGTLALEELRSPELDTDTLWKSLLVLPGVGPYAAACLLIYLGRYDRVNVDSWARMLVGKELGRPVTNQETHQFFEPYGEWRALVYHFYPWKASEG